MNKSDKTNNTLYNKININKMVSSSALLKHETGTTLNSVSVVTLPTAIATTTNFVEQQQQQTFNKCQQIINKNVVHPQQTIQQLSGNAKMGSRRIFTPQFKLQVLESYRNDNDCKGNQRATARKYNIHRRQIQKWLQCEPNLRSSVANINQSQVKHQFHNITHHQQQQQPHQHHHHQHHQQLATKQLNSTLTVPSLVVNTQPPTVSANHNNNMSNSNNININNNNNSNNDVLTAANFAAAVAVAATMANNAANSNERTTLSPLRGSSVTIDEAQHFHHLPPHHHHHHHQHAYAAAYTYQHPQLYTHHHNLLGVAHHLPPPPPPHLPLHNHHQLYTPVTQQHEYSGAFRPATAALWPQVAVIEEETNNKESLEVDVVDADIEVETQQKHLKTAPTTTTTTAIATATATITPIDLSITKRNSSNNGEENKTKCTNSLVVDLTFRKRKVMNTTAPKTDDLPAEKISKCNGNNNNDVSSTSAAAKPVKLFKPYLLDDEENENDDDVNQQHTSKQLPLAPIPLTPQPQTDVGLVGGTFQNDKYTFPYFPANGALFSPSSASVPALSPSSFRCPKGSPVSGYESSSSTYSDSSFRGNDSSNIILSNGSTTAIRTSLAFELRAVYSPPHAHQHVQRWLDQDTQSCLTPATTPTPTTTPTPPNHNHIPPAAHTSIALYA